MGTDRKKYAESAQARSQIYGLLATLFREEPTSELIQEIRNPRLAGVFSALDVSLGDDFYTTPESDLLETLGLEFTHLFIGPDHHLSAHESVFMENDGGGGGLWGARTVKVKNFIEATGLDYESVYTGMPDHISVEFECMQKLTEWEADQWARNNSDRAKESQKIQRMFLEEHLLCWCSKLCDAVIAEATIPFYKAIAELAKNYMEFEQKEIATDKAA